MVEIYKIPYGLEQRSRFCNPDFHDEYIQEVEFSSIFSLDTISQLDKSLPIIICGDENSGKTSYLYSFVDSDSGDFTRLQSFLPTVVTSFQNENLTLEKAVKVCRDEGTFLDSDLARARVTLTKASAIFLLSELGLSDHSKWTDDADFITLNFLEIGKDHINRVMNYCQGIREESLFDNMAENPEICDTTLRMLATVNLETIIYVINATLTDEAGYIDNFKRILTFLSNKAPSLKRINIMVSRLRCGSDERIEGNFTRPGSTKLDPIIENIIHTYREELGDEFANNFEASLHAKLHTTQFIDIKTMVLNAFNSAKIPHKLNMIYPFDLFDPDIMKISAHSTFFLTSLAISEAVAVSDRADDDFNRIVYRFLECLETLRYTGKDAENLELTNWITPPLLVFANDIISENEHRSIKSIADVMDIGVVPSSTLVATSTDVLSKLASFGAILTSKSAAEVHGDLAIYLQEDFILDFHPDGAEIILLLSEVNRTAKSLVMSQKCFNKSDSIKGFYVPTDPTLFTEVMKGLKTEVLQPWGTYDMQQQQLRGVTWDVQHVFQRHIEELKGLSRTSLVSLILLATDLLLFHVRIKGKLWTHTYTAGRN